MTDRKGKKDAEGFARMKADLQLNFLLAEIEGRLQEPSDELLRETHAGVLSAIMDFDVNEAAAVASLGPSSMTLNAFNKLSDFIAGLSRFDFVEMNIGTLAIGRNDDGDRRSAGRRAAARHFCTWKQNGLQFTLSCMSKMPFTVTLQIDEGPDVELRELVWIDEDDVEGVPDRPVNMESFALKRLPDSKRTYQVGMDVVAFTARMGAIYAAKEGEAADDAKVRLLLPFVVSAEEGIA
jgi:hypothetical protein